MYEFSQPLGDVIKEGRRRAGLTQKDVSIALDMDYRTLQNIETGKGNPCMDKLYPLMGLWRFSTSKMIMCRVSSRKRSTASSSWPMIMAPFFIGKQSFLSDSGQQKAGQ